MFLKHTAFLFFNTEKNIHSFNILKKSIFIVELYLFLFFSTNMSFFV